eukprot:CAMPEP_0178553998 /NCGR_PEP_ID=MMETSP0697-20121206/8105_1 /TAXON_ID=265572 /ORGANISM="Extubocellulus spinifer, Strain CCMP396" /LENGTH=1084 /DNA_ID=CAMNT_0020186931 /DNA_START=138 /DNA_END=3392 /DNA_ORIENTATION=+
MIVAVLILTLTVYLKPSNVVEATHYMRRRQSSTEMLRTGAILRNSDKAVLSSSSLGKNVSPNREGRYLAAGNTIGQERQLQTTAISSVQTFRVKLALILQYIDQESADILDQGESSNPLVHRLCSAVKIQSGGSQARKSAAEDGLLVSTRSDYRFPSTGCRILDTNRVYYPEIEFIGLEVLVSQEVSISRQIPPTSNATSAEVESGPISYDSVYRHVSRGFSGGTGGRAKFRHLLMSEDAATGSTIEAFQALENVVLIKRLSDPIPIPTRAPTRSPTVLAKTARPSRQPSKGKPSTKTPTIVPSNSPVTTEPTTSTSQDQAGPILILRTNPPTPQRPLAPGYDGSAPDDTSSTPRTDSSDNSNDILPIAAIAAAAGAVLGIFVVAMISLYRYRKELQEYRKREGELPVATAVPSPQVVRTRTRGWGSVPSQQQHPPSGSNGNATPTRLGARSPPPIPAIVNDADGRSLAESTLGDRTAGRKAWAPPPPPVQFLKTTWIPGDGRKGTATSTGMSIAASQISSLDSGTIGAGGGETVGGFSLEAAIKDDDSDEAENEAIQAGNASAGSDDGVALDEDGKGDDGPDQAFPGDDEKTEAIPGSEVSATAPFSTPNDSLVGTASLFEASTLSLSDEVTGTSASVTHSNVTPVPDPPLDPTVELTPRASGAGGGSYWTPPLLPQGGVSDDNSSVTSNCYVLPPALTPERKKKGGLANTASPDETERSWSSIFAAGTAAVLAASFRGSPDAPPSPVPAGGTPRPGSPASQFPDSGPLVDTTASDETSKINESDISRILDKSLAALKESQTTTSSVVNIVSPDRADVGSRSPEQLPCSPATPASIALPNPAEEEKALTASSASSASDDNNPWLLEAVTEALGPRGENADMESLSGRSNPSTVSARSAHARPSKKTKSSKGSGRSVGSRSRSSRQSHRSQGSLESRSIASDLQRLETQLKMLDEKEKDELHNSLSVTSGVEGSVCSTSPTTPRSKHSSMSTATRTRLEIRAPPGRLGIILANRADGQGTVISALRTSSALVDKILPGDVLAAIDGQDVSKMHVSEVTAIMSSKAQYDKVLTVITPIKQREGYV